MEVAEKRNTAVRAVGAFAADTGQSLTVLVPCYNEVATVGSLLEQLRVALPDAQVVVIDDGSSDGSAELVEGLRQSLGVTVIRNYQQSGKGAAVRAGLMHASRDWVVIQDADLEYEPTDLQRLLEVAHANPSCAIYGSRYLQCGRAPQGSVAHYMAVKILAFLAAILYRRHLTDPHTCYKMLTTKQMRDLGLQSAGFEVCAEITSKLLAVGVPVIEVPVAYHPRSSAGGKKIRLRDFFTAVATYVRFRLLRDAVSTAKPNSNRSHHPPLTYLVSRFLIGALLVIGGGMKLAPWREIAFLPWFVLPSAAVFLIGLIEFVLGCLVLSYSGRRLISLATRTAFTVYITVLFLQLWSGQSACDCLGSRSLPILWMLVFDCLLLATMGWYRCDWKRSLATLRSQRSAWRDLLWNVRIALPLLIVVGMLMFGSLDAAISYVSGARLVAANSTIHAGDLVDGETAAVTFSLTNYGSRPVRVSGAKATCSCLAWDNLPITIDPGVSRQITIRIRGSGPGPRIQRESAYLAFDDASAFVALTVTARVKPLL